MYKPKKRPAPKKYGVSIQGSKTPAYSGGFRPIQNVGANPIGRPGAGSPQAPGGGAATPATPGYNPQPLSFDPVYQNSVASANLGYDQTLAANAYQRNRVKQTYGFDDPSDPFNRAAMLQKAYQQRTSGTTNSFAASGQLYSGATQRNLDQGRTDYDQSYSGLRRQYEDELQGLTQADLAAGVARDRDRNEAMGESIRNQPPPEDPGGPSGPSPRETQIRNALMSHPKNWSQRPRLTAELARLRAQRGA